ncbi:hypothetical protein [Emticicia sp. TH156]|uniref:hypothetical protein n=1 Tax=Emticicia sp. TH156 TaxID=2067454 RepID=UPI000C77A842|nr:hypothetical protein [Emticicia sp. TH156]
MKATDNATNAAMEAINNLEKEARDVVKTDQDEPHTANMISISALKSTLSEEFNAGIKSLREEDKANIKAVANADNATKKAMAEAENAVKLIPVGDSKPGEAMHPNKNATDEAENSLRTAEQEAGIPMSIPANLNKNATDEAQKAMNDANEYLETGLKEAQDTVKNLGK